MPRHATETSYKAGEEHIYWKGGAGDYWRREARKVMKCPKGFVVHHVDGNYKNNDIGNLRIMKQSDHVVLHTKQRGSKVKPNCKIRTVIKGVLTLKRIGYTRREIAGMLDINFRMVKKCCTTEWRNQYE